MESNVSGIFIIFVLCCEPVADLRFADTVKSMVAVFSCSDTDHICVIRVKLISVLCCRIKRRWNVPLLDDESGLHAQTIYDYLIVTFNCYICIASQIHLPIKI